MLLDKSSIVEAMSSGGTLSLVVAPCKINGNPQDWMHSLVDGAHPAWSVFVTAFTSPINPKKKKFATEQEKVRHVLQRPLRGWCMENLVDLVHACAIVHVT